MKLVSFSYRWRNAPLPQHIMRRKVFCVYDPQGALLFEVRGFHTAHRELCLSQGLQYIAKSQEHLYGIGYRIILKAEKETECQSLNKTITSLA